MYQRICTFVLSVLVLIILTGCAGRIPITYNQLQKNLYVDVKTKTGLSYEGVVKAKNNDYIVLQTSSNKASLSKIERANINNILSSPPIYDYQKDVISEFVIRENQNNTNTWLYTIGGTGLSFGASFFIGSLLHRSISDDDMKNTALWATTGVGTLAGTLLFYSKGRDKDRQIAVNKIREARYRIAKKDFIDHKTKRDKMNQELLQLKTERNKQSEEIKRLRKKIKEKDNNRKNE